MSWSSQISWKTQSGWLGPKVKKSLVKALTKQGLKFSELSNQTWDSGFVDGVQDKKLSSLRAQKKGWSSLLLPLNCNWDHELATELSKICNPVILFVEVKQIAWGFMVYDSGKRVRSFMRSSAYDKRTPDPQDVDPTEIAKFLSVETAQISPYLQQLDDSASGNYDNRKAFADDECPLSNHWVRVDLMRRVGIDYPDPSKPETRYVLIER